MRLTCFLDEGFDVDVDNVAKPILDALKGGLVLTDDALVVELTVRKAHLGVTLILDDPPREVADALETRNPFVHIEVDVAPTPHRLRYGSP